MDRLVRSPYESLAVGAPVFLGTCVLVYAYMLGRVHSCSCFASVSVTQFARLAFVA